MITRSNDEHALVEFQFRTEKNVNGHSSVNFILRDIYNEEIELKEQEEPEAYLTDLIREVQIMNLDFTGIHIQNLPISFLPESILTLESLRTISITRTLLEEIPDFLNAFNKLKKLSIHDSEITQISNSYGLLDKLKSLTITGSGLTNICDTITSLSDLEYLGLGSNFIEFVPSNIKNLKQLKRLDLYNNLLKEIPIELKELNELEILWLNGNSFDSKKNSDAKDMLPYVQVILGKPIE